MTWQEPQRTQGHASPPAPPPAPPGEHQHSPDPLRTPPPPRRPAAGARKRQITLAAVALCTALALGAWAVAASNSGTPSANQRTSPDAAGTTQDSGGMSVKWAILFNSAASTFLGMANSWTTPKTVIDGRQDGMIAYSLSNGAQAWS